MSYRFDLVVVVLIYSIISQGMENNNSARYTRALELRDQKIPESTKCAEQLFLELALEGHTKAMHNFALIQYDKGNYELAYEWFNKADLVASNNNVNKMLKEGKVKQELHLVVGSTRKTSGSFGPLVDAIYGPNIDLSHTNTFGGNATTMDILPCEQGKAAHIVADARIFDFSRYAIGSVFLEKLPSVIDVSSPEHEKLSRDIDHLKQNHIGVCIKNVAKSMKIGATMEMEWLPYTGLYWFRLDELTNFIESNPFHCFFNINVVLQSVFILSGEEENINVLPNEFVEPTRAMVEKLRSQLEFYHEQGVGNEGFKS